MPIKTGGGILDLHRWRLVPQANDDRAGTVSCMVRLLWRACHEATSTEASQSPAKDTLILRNPYSRRQRRGCDVQGDAWCLVLQNNVRLLHERSLSECLSHRLSPPSARILPVDTVTVFNVLDGKRHRHVRNRHRGRAGSCREEQQESWSTWMEVSNCRMIDRSTVRSKHGSRSALQLAIRLGNEDHKLRRGGEGGGGGGGGATTDIRRSRPRLKATAVRATDDDRKMGTLGPGRLGVAPRLAPLAANIAKTSLTEGA